MGTCEFSLKCRMMYHVVGYMNRELILMIFVIILDVFNIDNAIYFRKSGCNRKLMLYLGIVAAALVASKNHS